MTRRDRDGSERLDDIDVAVHRCVGGWEDIDRAQPCRRCKPWLYGAARVPILGRGRPERDFEQQLVRAAEAREWLLAHTRPIGATRGAPDLVLLRGEHLVFLEVKSPGGRLSPHQRRWLDALAHVTRVDARVIRPSDLHDVLAALT